MYLLSKDELTNLTTRRPGWHVSLFMPMHRASIETQQNPIRCKNLMREAETQLLDSGLGTAEVQQLLEPVEQLLDDYSFWQHQSDGLALFLSPHLSRSYRLPLAFEDLAVVAGRFHVKPLLPLFTGDGRFYVLALSQNAIRMLECTRHSARQLELEDVPPNLAEALKYDDPEKQLQYHTGTQTTQMPGGAGGQAARRSAMYHGHGVGTDDDKVNLVRYFRKVAQGLHDVLRDEQVPLVLAGVDYLLPLYREANAYAHLVEEGITGNPEGLRTEELHEQGWRIVEPLFAQQQAEAAAAYKRYMGTGRASNDLLDIVPAAYNGRVDSLFVATGVQQWGSFDPDTQEVRLQQEATPENEDLLDSAAVHTFLNSGTVYAVTPDAMPDSTPIAAVYRY